MDNQKLGLFKVKYLGLSQIRVDVQMYTEDTFGDLEVWLTIQTDAKINALKNR